MGERKIKRYVCVQRRKVHHGSERAKNSRLSKSRRRTRRRSGRSSANFDSRAWRERPPDSVSLLTDLKRVWIIPADESWSAKRLLTLKQPKEEQIWSDIETHGMRKGRDTDETVEEWEWTPDIPIEVSLTTAWFMNLINLDGRKLGVVGLIVREVDLPRRVFERIGILKHTYFKTKELSNHWGIRRKRKRGYQRKELEQLFRPERRYHQVGPCYLMLKPHGVWGSMCCG